MLIHIEARHFVAGVVTRHNVVVRAAPIVRYMEGWHRNKVEAYCKFKNWKWKVVK